MTKRREFQQLIPLHGGYTEDDLIQLSALQHLVFCERQCALIHIEQLWNENLFTAEGRIMHDKVDTANKESRGNIRIEYGVPIRSLRLGLIGKADVVEFHRKDDGMWMPFPVEYKRGKPKMDDCDKVQLCAQAICLEEMLNVEIKKRCALLWSDAAQGGCCFRGKIAAGDRRCGKKSTCAD